MPRTLLLGPAIGEEGTKIVAGGCEAEPRKSREQVTQVGAGVQSVAVATGDQTEMDGSALSAPFAATKEPVPAADRSTPQCAFAAPLSIVSLPSVV